MDHEPAYGTDCRPLMVIPHSLVLTTAVHLPSDTIIPPNIKRLVVQGAHSFHQDGQRLLEMDAVYDFEHVPGNMRAAVVNCISRTSFFAHTLYAAHVARSSTPLKHPAKPKSWWRRLFAW